MVDPRVLHTPKITDPNRKARSVCGKQIYGVARAVQRIEACCGRWWWREDKVVMKEVRGSKQIETKEISSTDTNQDEQGGGGGVKARW